MLKVFFRVKLLSCNGKFRNRADFNPGWRRSAYLMQNKGWSTAHRGRVSFIKKDCNSWSPALAYTMDPKKLGLPLPSFPQPMLDMMNDTNDKTGMGGEKNQNLI